MWKLLLKIADEVRVQKRPAPNAPSSPEENRALILASELERMGRSLDLVTRLIREAADANGMSLVQSRERQIAAELLKHLISSRPEREAHGEFLKQVMPDSPNTDLPDLATVNAIPEQRWAQLSSVLLAKLLLNPIALEFLGRKVLEVRPAAWSDSLPAPREAKAAGTRSSKKAAIRTRR